MTGLGGEGASGFREKERHVFCVFGENWGGGAVFINPSPKNVSYAPT